MTRKEVDLILVVACSLVLTAIIVALPSARPARIILGLPFVLFFPGYTLIAALYPRKDDLDAIERTALSLGLSIAVVPLIGLALNYSPWGIRLNPILAFVTLFIVLAAAAAAYRRRSLPVEEAFGITVDVQLARWSQARMIGRVLALALVVSLAGLGVAAYFVATSRGSSERFTEFYVLGPAGKAEAYPSLVKVGENAAVILGLVNHEGGDASYRVVVRIDGGNTNIIDNLVLADGERWERRIALVPTRVGENQKAEFLLYKDGGSDPYRSLHLWLDVEGALVGATHPPQVLPSPTPGASPTATPPAPPVVSIGPAGLIYVVQPDDTLTALSERFGLSPEAIAAANGMAQPGPLLAGQELVIPGTVYTVQPGDTVASIAGAFGVPLATIMTANGIADPSAIGVGQKLAIPGGGELPTVQTPSPTPEQPGLTPTPTPTATPTATSTPTATATPTVTATPTPTPEVTPSPQPTPVTYIIQPGDTLEDIAARFGVDVESLAAANGITDPNLILVGQELIIPAPGPQETGG